MVTIAPAVVPLNAQFISSLASAAGGPSGLDRALRDAGLNPLLVNPFLATIIDIPVADIGQVVCFPVHIGPGGRKSLYELNVGEKVLAYLLCSPSLGVLFKYAERLTGNGAVATGDVFQFEYRRLDGTLVYSEKGPLTVTNGSIGEGEIAIGPRLSVWVIWSCIAVEK